MSAQNSERPTRYVRLRPISENAHPAVKRLYAEMQRQRCTVLELEHRSGINANTFTEWFRARTTPNVNNLEACLNAFDLTLTVARRPGESASGAGNPPV